MDQPLFSLTLIMRWLHIGGAIILIGAPFFIRLFLLPALSGEDPARRDAILDRINKPWRMFLGIVILFQIISGVYWLLAVVNIKTQPPAYQILLTIKLLAALGLFFLLSVLAGRAARTKRLRALLDAVPLVDAADAYFAGRAPWVRERLTRPDLSAEQPEARLIHGQPIAAETGHDG